MNKKYLLSSVTAGIAFLYANHGTAQCVTTQDCTALGYTETSCPNGGVKCPFGNKWFCGSSDDTYTENECMELACDKLGFKYDCVGTGYEGGEGEVCNGKYTFCKCAEGYGWKNGACVEKVCLKWSYYSKSCSQRSVCSLTPDGKFAMECQCTCDHGGMAGEFTVVGSIKADTCDSIDCRSLCRSCQEWGLPQVQSPKVPE